jgi:hypothetical protein
MTAFGLALMAISFFAAWYDCVIGLPKRLVKVFGGIGLVGIALFVFGVLTWVWRVMP